MELSELVAKHFREIHFGGNWSTSNIKEHLADVTWEEATSQVYDLNTIAALTFHINYYVSTVLKVLQGEPLVAKDALSFSHAAINSHEDWDKMKNKMLLEAEQFATLVEQLPENKFGENFTDEKYGNYYRNMHGIIEHCHYHLGQIVIIKKMIRNSGARSSKT